jgi:hypothetical protein
MISFGNRTVGRLQQIIVGLFAGPDMLDARFARAVRSPFEKIHVMIVLVDEQYNFISSWIPHVCPLSRDNRVAMKKLKWGKTR